MKNYLIFVAVFLGAILSMVLFTNSDDSSGTMVYKKNSSWSSSHAAVAELQEINTNLARIAKALEKLNCNSVKNEKLQ
jgi:peptidoglycan hydrolase CwlO-like protein